MDPHWEAVDQYVRFRIERCGDVYGWFRRDEATPSAVILTALHPSAEPFPSNIEGVHIELKPIPEPR